MRSAKTVLAAVILAAGTFAVARFAQPRPLAGAPFQDRARPVAERVADLVGRMTLEEKVSQLVNNAPVQERRRRANDADGHGDRPGDGRPDGGEVTVETSRSGVLMRVDLSCITWVDTASVQRYDDCL